MSKFIKLTMICPYSLWHFTDFPEILRSRKHNLKATCNKYRRRLSCALLHFFPTTFLKTAAWMKRNDTIAQVLLLGCQKLRLKPNSVWCNPKPDWLANPWSTNNDGIARSKLITTRITMSQIICFLGRKRDLALSQMSTFGARRIQSCTIILNQV